MPCSQSKSFKKIPKKSCSNSSSRALLELSSISVIKRQKTKKDTISCSNTNRQLNAYQKQLSQPRARIILSDLSLSLLNKSKMQQKSEQKKGSKNVNNSFKQAKLNSNQQNCQLNSLANSIQVEDKKHKILYLNIDQGKRTQFLQMTGQTNINENSRKKLQLNENRSCKFQINENSRSKIYNSNSKRSSFNSSRSSNMTHNEQSQFPIINLNSNQTKQKTFISQIIEGPLYNDLYRKNKQIDLFTKRSSNDLKQSQIQLVQKQTTQLQQDKQSTVQLQINHNQSQYYQQKHSNDSLIAFIKRQEQLNIMQQDIIKQAPQFINLWRITLSSKQNLQRNQHNIIQIAQRLNELKIQLQCFKNQLVGQNRMYISNKKLTSNNSCEIKHKILLEVDKLHQQVKKKIFRKDLEETMIFNMKVVLPSSLQNIQKSYISYFQPTLPQTSIIYLYEELMKHKASKKYGMILKKQINNMNMYDSKSMNDYIKRLFELQCLFNRNQDQDPQSQLEFISKIQILINKIDILQNQYTKINKTHTQLQKNINQDKKNIQQCQLKIKSLIQQISKTIYSQYKIYQTGEQINQQNQKEVKSQIKQKSIQQFYDLALIKYGNLLSRFKSLQYQKSKLRFQNKHSS